MQQERARAWAEVGAATYVSLGTYRRSGALVRTPVWVAAVDDALVVTTTASTGKVKRLRNDPRVVLRPCTARGRIAADAVTVEAVCEVVRPAAEQRSGTAALRRKYRLQYLLVVVIEHVVGVVRRRRPDRVILRITG